MTEIQVTEPPFKLGQKVRVMPGLDWRIDWAGTELTVIGMAFDRAGNLRCHVSEDWPRDGGIDDINPDHLTAA